jgi:hypothetical protein
MLDPANRLTVTDKKDTNEYDLVSGDFLSQGHCRRSIRNVMRRTSTLPPRKAAAGALGLDAG